MNNIYEQVEMDYRREELTRDFQAAQRLGLRGRIHGRRRHRRLQVVPPYGDARA
jgi:hypothetical protein